MTTIDRRVILAAPGLGLLGLVLGGCRGRDQADAERLPRTPPNFEEVLAGIERLAARLRAGDIAPELHIQEVAALAATITGLSPIALGEPFRGVMRTGLRHAKHHIALIEWSMDANNVYDAHDHPNYAGATLGLSGECRMRNFEPIGPLPAVESRVEFRLRETQSTLLRAGVVASLMTPYRDNIHKLHAGPDGVRGLDIVTLTAADLGFSFIALDEGSGDADRTFRATWGDSLRRTDRS